MGTPEFPDLGKHCMVEDCKQIDFLPFTCDRCNKVFCLEHRSFIKHQCPKGDKKDVTVVICPLCAKGVRLIPDEDPNVSWELHVNTECDPSNYDKVTKKRKCPVPGCRELLTFSNTIKCKDCTLDHCLKHRFGPDHKCPGPKKPETAFSFLSALSRSRKDTPPQKTTQVPNSSSRWSAGLLNAASSFRASTEAGMAKLGNEFNRALQIAKEGVGPSSGSASGARHSEVCPQCSAKFALVTDLVEHVQRVHENHHTRSGVRKMTIDVCPKCSKGFRDPVALVEHVERDHGGTSRA